MMYNLGLADGPQIDVIDGYTKSIVAEIEAKNYTKAFRLWDEMLNGDLFPYPNYFHNVTDSQDYDNFQRINAPASFGYYASFLNRKDVRRAIHAGDDTSYGGHAKDCEKALVPDFMVSMLPRVKRLLEEAKLPVLVYVGQLDIIIGTPLVAGWLNAFEWEGSSAYKNNARGVWRSLKPDSSADPQQGKDPVFGAFSVPSLATKGAAVLSFVFVVFSFVVSVSVLLFLFARSEFDPQLQLRFTHITHIPKPLHFTSLHFTRHIIDRLLPERSAVSPHFRHSSRRGTHPPRRRAGTGVGYGHQIC